MVTITMAVLVLLTKLQTVDDDFAKKRPKCVNVFKRVLKCQAMEKAVLDILQI